jgi:magnesium chelatase subunit I
MMQAESDEQYMQKLYAVDGLHSVVKQYYPKADEAQSGLLMEFLLHGLAEYSLISKKIAESGGYNFGDILGSMLNMNFSHDDEDDEDFDN